MQGDIDSLPGRPRVVSVEIQERIERRGRIGIQQRLPQSRLANLANGQVLPFVPGVTETCLPIPRLKVIGDPPHFTAQSHIKQLVPVSEFFAARTGIVNTTEPHTGRYRETTGGILWSRRKEIRNGRICNGERIKRIRDRHTDAIRAKERASESVLERIRRKRHSRQGRIEKRARIFEIRKYRQVFVTQVAGERAVVHLAVTRRQRRRESGEVKEEVVAAALIVSAKLIERYSRIVDTGSAWIRIWVNRKRALVKWRGFRIRS